MIMFLFYLIKHHHGPFTGNWITSSINYNVSNIISDSACLNAKFVCGTGRFKRLHPILKACNYGCEPSRRQNLFDRWKQLVVLNIFFFFWFARVWVFSGDSKVTRSAVFVETPTSWWKKTDNRPPQWFSHSSPCGFPCCEALCHFCFTFLHRLVRQVRFFKNGALTEFWTADRTA